jgi:hypothetical protein
MSAPAGHLGTAAGAEVYKALGVADRVSYHSDVVQTPHCSYKEEYTDLLQRNIARFLKHENAGNRGLPRRTRWRRQASGVEGLGNS